MQAIKHPVQHQYQSSNSNCSQTALSMLLGSYGHHITAEEIEEHVPKVYGEDGDALGSINQQLATWCLHNDYSVSLYTADCQVIDQTWKKLSKDKLLDRLELREKGWAVPVFGAHLTKEYAQSYIDFLSANGDLHIVTHISSQLLYKLLKDGPFLPCVSDSNLYENVPHTRHVKGGASVDDDVNGRPWNHSIVVYGNDQDGNFLVADPWTKPGLHVVEPDQLITAIATAQMECDNLLFQITPKTTHIK